jgi:hypothetical protein
MYEGDMSREPKSRAMQWLKGFAFLTGIAAVGLALLAWRIPGGDGTLGADVIFVSHLSGELQVSPVGPFITKAGLEPSDEAGGTLKIRNRTGRRLAIRPRPVPDNRELNGLLHLELESGNTRLFSGPLSRLPKDGARPFVLAPRESAPLTFRAWLPIQTRSGYQGRIVQIDVTFSVKPLAN